ncbi:interferon-inducible GTPase-domain-containing protein [Mycena haematopus]|nr:interferon-inducible GTPase-domain-containing protein [Mycena haematopus]
MATGAAIGATAAVIAPGAAIGGAIVGAMAIVGLLRSKRAGNNPTHDDIEEANRLRQEKQERDRAAQAAREEADRLAREVEMVAQQAREARAAMEAAQAETERIRREAEEARVAADQAAETEHHEAQRREQERQEEALRQQQLAEEENERVVEAQRTAEEAARKAVDETRAMLEAKAEVERQLREGIQPVVMPSAADLEDAKRRIRYRDGLYHFAVAGIAGGGKSSLINALCGLRNGDAGAAATGITETTLHVGRFPDSDPKNPFVWYDMPGAGTLHVPDWQYFNEQGLYVFDALVVLIDNRFTMTDVAILPQRASLRNPDMGYDSDDEEQDARSRATLKYAAREHFVSATRQNVRENLRSADLPDQRVYVVSNSTMLSATKSNIATKIAKKFIDEFDFLHDLWGEAYKRRGGVAKA